MIARFIDRLSDETLLLVSIAALLCAVAVIMPGGW